MKVIIVQPAVPEYRRAFFARLADRFGQDFAVYASQQSDLGVLGDGRTRPIWQSDLGPLHLLLPGLEWQSGALSVPIQRGDILVVCGAPRTLSTIALLLKGRLKGARTIWWGHYWSATSKPWRATLRFFLMRLSDVILFYTDQEVEEYRAILRRPTGKPIYGLNNGIENNEITKLRAPYISADRPRDLLFIGRITLKAEFDLLLEALARPECARITLDVIGDGAALTLLKKRAERLEISERIAWQGATVDEALIATVANRCKAFIYPGSVGLSLIHGLAYGLPAIVHDERRAQMPEIAAHEPGRNGVTFRWNDAVSLADSINGLLNDPQSLDAMSKEAVALVDRTFNAEDMATRFCNLVKIDLQNNGVRNET